MKPYINLLVAVIVAVVISTLYGVFTFQVDEPRKFVFSEPKLPSELIQNDEANGIDSKQKTLAVEEAQKALNYYRDEQKKAPQQANDTLALLVDRMTNSDLPLYFLSGKNPQNGGKRVFETLKISSASVLDPATATKKLNLSCTSKMPVATMILGTDGKDNITCDAMRDTIGQGLDPDYMLIGGPEDDQIIDSSGNRIVNGGTGNDTMTLGSGRNIIILDASWGKDTVKLDCTDARISTDDIPTGFAIPWIYKTTNFIVLGNSIDPLDIEWVGNVLTHKVTGDTLTVTDNCFTVVPKLATP